MFRHLLIPLDGSATAEVVLPVARYLCELTGASVTLLHAIEKHARPTIHNERHLTDGASAEAYLDEVGRNAFAPGTAINCHVHDPGVGDVAGSIAAHAAEMNADLIILCTHGRGDLSRFLFGTIAQQVVTTTTRPVLIVPHRLKERDRPFACRCILAPVDVGGGHEEGVDLALELAALCRAEIHFVATVPTLSTLTTERAAAAQVLPASTSVLLEMERDRTREELARRAAAAEQRGLRVQAELLRGRPAEAIIEAAQHLRPDLIVMATHGRRGLDGLISGSVGSRLCAASPVCLLISPIRRSPA